MTAPTNMTPPKHRTVAIRKLAAASAIILLTVLARVPAASADTVLVFAASSLTEALSAVARRFEKRRGGEIVLSFASSAALARQIESGAPADIYVSADVQWMDYLERQNLIRAGTRRDLLSNRLVLIAPKRSDLETTKLTPDLRLATWLGDGRLAMGNPNHVPAGIYGKQALKSLKLWTSVRRNVAHAEDVRAALALVALGEAPLGIVYTTDAVAEDGVKIIGTFAKSAHSPIVYPVALTVESKAPCARAFLDYMRSNDANMIYRRYGFKILP